ncbi:RecX family transcriptional regulator [Vibrio mediterranei]|uniref:RecX family transcriptional regulator n=1 Tax=Vibrio mediterranei TaxID=689 RepID=UPI0040681B0F
MQKDTAMQKRPFQARQFENVLNSAIYRLGQRDLSIHQLRAQLTRKTDNHDWIEQAITKCLELGYLKSDEAFAKHYAETAFRNDNGRTFIARKLKEKGITESVSTNAIDAVMSEYNINEETLLQNRLGLFSDFSSTSREKLISSLTKRGFSHQMIVSAINAREDVRTLKTNAQIKGSKANLETEVLKLFRKDKGPRVIEMTLKQKYIDTQGLAGLLDQLSLSGEIDFWASALRALEKKKFDLTDRADKQKAYAFLNQRGFTSEQIKESIQEAYEHQTAC